MVAKHTDGEGSRGARRHKLSAVSTFVTGVRDRRTRARTHLLAKLARALLAAIQVVAIQQLNLV